MTSVRIIPTKANKETLIRVTRTSLHFVQGIRRGFFQLGAKLVRDGQKKIVSGTKTGRLYRIKGRKGLHRASAPGEAPANITGKLRRSVDREVQGADTLEFGYRDSAPYGKFLEDGTAKMEKRPNIIPTVKENEKNAKVMIAQNINRRLRK